MMDRSEFIALVRQGKHYMDKAEQARWRLVECQKRYDETLTVLDKLRRRMVFVENETSGTLELVNTIMELEKVREEKRSMENKLKNYINASLSYSLSAVESLNIDSTYITSQISLVLRQAVMLIRSTRDLNIDFSCIYAQAAKTKITVNYTNNDNNRINYGNIPRYLNQLLYFVE